MAQVKIGHIDGTTFLTSLDQYKSAEKELETYMTQLDNQYKTMVEKYQREYGDVQTKIQQGLLTPKQISEQEQYFMAEQKKIQEFEMSSQKKTLGKREELLTPILTRVEDAIKAVAAQNNFTYILDSSAGLGVLFAADSEDVTSLVNKQLGY